ncbi:MAG: glucosamine-6-phosphate deaminase [Acidimicrobiales bacterium]
MAPATIAATETATETRTLPRLFVYRSATVIADAVAQVVHQYVTVTDDPVLGLATGVTMDPVYAELVERYRRGSSSFDHASFVQLDEYLGLHPGSPHRFRHSLLDRFIDPTDARPEALASPDVDDPLLDAAAAAFERRIAVRPIGLQLLGIGRNGHIGFNEPGTPFDAPTRVVPLTPDTMQANRRHFPSAKDMPTHAMTQGISTIMAAHRIVLIVVGAAKQEALTRALTGPVTPDLPASILQRHPDVTVIADATAAAGLDNALGGHVSRWRCRRRRQGPPH